MKFVTTNGVKGLTFILGVRLVYRVCTEIKRCEAHDCSVHTLEKTHLTLSIYFEKKKTNF